MAELTGEQRESIRARIYAYSGYICPDCLPDLSVEVTAARWRLTVDHSEGCASYAWHLVGRALDLFDLDPRPTGHPQGGSTP